MSKTQLSESSLGCQDHCCRSRRGTTGSPLGLMNSGCQWRLHSRDTHAAQSGQWTRPDSEWPNPSELTCTRGAIVSPLENAVEEEMPFATQEGGPNSGTFLGFPWHRAPHRPWHHWHLSRNHGDKMHLNILFHRCPDLGSAPPKPFISLPSGSKALLHLHRYQR